MHHHEHRRHGGFEAGGRRGFRGAGGFGDFGGRFGGFGGMGDGIRLGRMLAGGDLRLVALYLIEEQPRHGYDLIKAIEEKSAGFYSPSPGVIYPALTYLEEAGYATSASEGNKKAYAITPEGKAHLDENRASIAAILEQLGKIGRKMSDMRDRMSGEHGPRDRDIPDVLPEVNAARRALKQAIAEAVRGDESAQRRLAEILQRAADEIGKGQVDI